MNITSYSCQTLCSVDFLLRNQDKRAFESSGFLPVYACLFRLYESEEHLCGSYSNLHLFNGRDVDREDKNITSM